MKNSSVPEKETQKMSILKRLFQTVVCVALDIDQSDYRKQLNWRKIFSYSALIGFLFVLPALASNIIFDWIPMLDGIYKSFFTWTNKNPELVFVGMGNFLRVLKDPEFLASIQNMVFFLIANLLLMFPTIFFSVVLFRVKNDKNQYVYRVLTCLPMVVPGLVFTLMWIFILGYDFGAINNLLVSMGYERIMFLSNPAYIKWTILLTGIPFVSANTALIYLGGLNGISDSVWDASKIDGVGPIRKFFSLELPLILGQFKLNLIGVIGASITAYGTQLIYHNSAVHSGIITPGLLMYFKAFPNTGAPDYGYSYALGLILFVVSLTISLLAMKFIKSDH